LQKKARKNLAFFFALCPNKDKYWNNFALNEVNLARIFIEVRMQKAFRKVNFLFLGVLLMLTGCGDDDDDSITPAVPSERVNITRARFVFEQDGGGRVITTEFLNPDGAGGQAPILADPVELPQFVFHRMRVELFNELDPDNVLDISAQLIEEAEEHRVFYMGGALDSEGGFINLSYVPEDLDENDLPVGLTVFIIPFQTGEGELKLRIKHIPPLSNGNTGKTTATYETGGSIVFETTLTIRVV